MSDEHDLIRGSGNVYRDLGLPHPALAQARATVAAEIIRVMNERELSTRDAQTLTGVSHAEFSRIRNAQLRRFTLDRLILILCALAPDVDVAVSFVNVDRSRAAA